MSPTTTASRLLLPILCLGLFAITTDAATLKGKV